MTAPLQAYTDAILFTGESYVEGHALLTKDGIVTDIVPQKEVPTDAKITSHAGKLIAPGLIDLQVNGGGNVLFNTTPTSDGVKAIAAAHKRFGTSYIMPTCVTDMPDITKQAIAAMRDARATCSSVLGIHLEGPHINPQSHSMHKTDYIRPLEASDLSLYRPEGDEVMLITLAPENAAFEQVSQLAQQGVVLSIGHTRDATPEQINALLKAGVTGFTHLFNVMGTLSAREPGVIGTALDDRNGWCGLITDGFHVADSVIRLALRAKPVGKIYLVSDSMPPAATDNPQDFTYCGTVMKVNNGRCTTPDGRLAGASICLLDAVRYCVKKVGVELDEALRMASTYPAAYIRRDKHIGRLLPGYRADHLVIDPNTVTLHAVG
ncbi:MAG: N-acetylglucosamine-6-phosphate deacetylase [Alphaproteobacteria bacterium]|nr:N-acetylglucosamine-6-phosphate deacetylase [Alphaproteobacteria bacterium]